MAIKGQLGAMFSTVLMLGTRLTKEPLFEILLVIIGNGESVMNYALTLKAFPLFTSLPKTNHEYTWNQDLEGKWETFINSTSVNLRSFFVSSYSESLISWWQIHVYSAHVCSCYSAEKTQEVTHILAYFSIILSRPNDHVSWERRGGGEPKGLLSNS